MISKYASPDESMCTPPSHLKNKLEVACLGMLTGNVSWQKWESLTVETSKTKRQFLIDKTGTVKECIEDLCRQVKKLPSHLFMAKWQRSIFEKTEDSATRWVCHDAGRLRRKLPMRSSERNTICILYIYTSDCDPHNWIC